jgi:hypothetical protein
MKYWVRVKNDGTLLDVLLSLGKTLYDDEVSVDGANDTDTLAKVASSSALASDTSESDEDNMKEELEKQYQAKAQNLAVVDMRDGYIFKIAPVRESRGIGTSRHLRRAHHLPLVL